MVAGPARAEGGGGAVPLATCPDVSTPYLFPAYDSTLLRAPLEPLIEAPAEWVSQSPGPDAGRIPVPAGGADLLHRHEGQPIGERIVIDGRVLDSSGLPLPGALVEMWQTNAAGIYEDPSDPGFFPHDPNFTGAGRCLTSAEGRFRFRTVKPGAYPQAPGQIYRPSHIHFSVFGPTLGSRLITQCYFEGDPLIGRDPIARAATDGLPRLIARLDPEATQSDGSLSALTYRYDITLPGPGDRAANPSQTVGPRYGYSLMFDGSERAVSPAEPGALEIRGTIIDGHGQAVAYPDAMLEFWAPGQFARTRTGPGGEYRAVLRKPPPARLPCGLSQAPHLDVAVFARGLLKQVQARLYFPDEEQANAADPVLLLVPAHRRPTLVARPNRRGLRFDIRLQGAGETAFFAF